MMVMDIYKGLDELARWFRDGKWSCKFDEEPGPWEGCHMPRVRALAHHGRGLLVLCALCEVRRLSRHAAPRTSETVLELLASTIVEDLFGYLKRSCPYSLRRTKIIHRHKISTHSNSFHIDPCLPLLSPYQYSLPPKPPTTAFISTKKQSTYCTNTAHAYGRLVPAPLRQAHNLLPKQPPTSASPNHLHG